MLLVLAAGRAEADKTWTGAQSGLWSDGRNWQDGSPPHTGDTLFFPSGTPSVVNNDIPSLATGEITVQGDITLNGNPLSVGGELGLLLFGGSATINVPLTLTSGWMGFSRGTYVFTRNLSVPGGTLTMDGSNTVVEFRGSITESSRASLNAFNMDAFTMTGTLFFTGDYHFQGANLATTGQGLGQGTSPASISALQVDLAAPGIIVRALHLESPLTGGTMVFTPTLESGYGGQQPQSHAIDLLRDVHLGAPLQVSGVLTGGGTLTIDSRATLYLGVSGSAYAGVITVASGGALVPQVNGAFPSASYLTVASGGRFDIAATSQHITNFTCAGTLALKAGASLHANAVNVEGCQLELTMPTDGGGFEGGISLVVNDGSAAVTGTFASLPEGATVMVNGVARQITYQGGDGNDVMLLPIELQDMWWVGAAENGWGMSLIQHGDRLFSVIFAYDAQGKPTWYVMPGGTWDSTRTAYQGSLYTPHGTPYYAYAATSLIVGNPVGSMKIQVQDDSHLAISYTIAGISGAKTLTRQGFGPPGAAQIGDRGDMWWGGASQNGWGIAILEQAPTIFPIWYTYDATGNATWFVVPVGSFTATNRFEGRAYTTTGPPWLGAAFDPSRVRATDAGSFDLDFNGDSAVLTYSIGGHEGSVPLVKEPF